MNIANQLRKADRESTVFTVSEIQTLLAIPDKKTVNNSIQYAHRIGELIRVSEGIYALDKEYSKYEFSNKFRSPSYVSLYSVLFKEGVVFQFYSSIFAIGKRKEEKSIEDQRYLYRKIKDDILLNPLGINFENGVSIASVERAVCDKLYLDGEEYFDNLRPIDWKLMKRLNSEVFFNNSVIALFIEKYESSSD